MRLMPMIIASTGRAAMRREASSSEKADLSSISTIVTAHPWAHAAARMPSSMVRLPTCVTSYAHRPTAR